MCFPKVSDIYKFEVGITAYMCFEKLPKTQSSEIKEIGYCFGARSQVGNTSSRCEINIKSIDLCTIRTPTGTPNRWFQNEFMSFLIFTIRAYKQ